MLQLSIICETLYRYTTCTKIEKKIDEHSKF